jgi:phosphatidylglycerophosphate synthase
MTTPESVSGAKVEDAPRRWGWSVDERILRNQKSENAISVYWPRKLSKYVTVLLLNLGVSGNQTTLIWGLLSVANSAIVYYAILGNYYLIPAVFAMYFIVEVFDCSDGEVARCRNTASPIGGKLLDGLAHKATEYSLLVAYILALNRVEPPTTVLPLALALLTGEAMINYAFERRILVIRLHAKKQTYISPTTANDVYTAGETWRDFPARKKLNSFYGLIQYKSVYFMIALGLISPRLLLPGVALLAAYKHYAWMKLLITTLYRPPELQGE